MPSGRGITSSVLDKCADHQRHSPVASFKSESQASGYGSIAGSRADFETSSSSFAVGEGRAVAASSRGGQQQPHPSRP